MKSRNDRSRRRPRLECLEDRNAPSRVGALGAMTEAVHHHRQRGHIGGGAAIQTLAHHGVGNHHQAMHVVLASSPSTQSRHDDPAGHDANDDKGGSNGNSGANMGGGATGQGGQDDPAGHDANDDNGVDAGNHKGHDGGGHH